MDRSRSNPSQSTPFGQFIVNRPKTVILVWFLVILSAIPSASQLKDRLVVAGVVEGAEATLVDETLASEFKDISQNFLILAINTALNDIKDPGSGISELADQLKTLDFVSRTNWLTPKKGGKLSGSEMDSLFLIVHLKAYADPMDALSKLRILTERKLTDLRQTDPLLSLQWTGESAIREAIITSSNKDLRKSELRSLPLIFLLLLLAFRSFIAALIPLLFGALAILLTLASVSILAEFITLSVMVQSVASLLGLALGIDYALLMTNRFREALIVSESSRQAALFALRQGGKTVVISGSAVAIGFAGLTLVPVGQMRSIACAGLLVAVFSVMLAATLVPAILVLLGKRIEFGAIPGVKGPQDRSSKWDQWARFVCRRPLIVLVISSLPLFALAFAAQQMSSSFPEENWLPPQSEAVQALKKLESLDDGNLVKRLKILYSLPDGVSALDGEGTRALRNLHRHLIKDKRSNRVRSLLTFSGSSLSLRTLAGDIPDEVLNRYTSDNRQIALLELIPDSRLDQQQLTVLVDHLRRMNIKEVTGLGGTIQVGGLPAAAVDYQAVIQHWFPYVIFVVALGSFLALSVAFRSILIPLKAVMLNLLAVFAAYGALVLVFVEGFGVALFGLAEPILAVFPATPVLVFCAAFGISMDYEVFLISRIAEARKNSTDETEAIVEGLTKTGRLITSAAAIMVSVFGAFALGDVLPTKILGFALAAVVALDAVLIRMALGPAMIRLAGRFNWWPGR